MAAPLDVTASARLNSAAISSSRHQAGGSSSRFTLHRPHITQARHISPALAVHRHQHKGVSRVPAAASCSLSGSQATHTRSCLCGASSCGYSSWDYSSSSSRGTNNPTSSSSSSSSSSNVPPDEDLPDATTMAILSAQTWEQLYDMYYSSTGAPTHQHCYGYLIALSELLPELDPPAAPAVAAAGIGVAGSSSSGGGGAADLDNGWEALRAAGKVVSWNQLTGLRALIRDLIKVVGSQLSSFNSRQLLELLQAVCVLSRPPPRWLSVWCDVLVSRLKSLSCLELTTAAEVLLLHQLTPNKPWVGLWCVAMEKHLPTCSQQQLVLSSLAVGQWGVKPPPSWVKPYSQSLTNHLDSLSPPELLLCSAAAVGMGLKLTLAQQAVLHNVTLSHLKNDVIINNSRHQQQYRSAQELLRLLQGCLLLGLQPSVDWLVAYMAAVQQDLASSSSSSSGGGGSGSGGQEVWDISAVAALLVVLSSAAAAGEALAAFDSTATPAAAAAAGGGGGFAAAGSSGSNVFLQAVVSYTEPLLASEPQPGPLVDLLWGFKVLHYTPTTDYLDLLLDEAGFKLQSSSMALLKQHYPQHPFHTSNTHSSSRSGTEGEGEDDSSSSSSSSSSNSNSGSFTVADWSAPAKPGSSSSSSSGSTGSSEEDESMGRSQQSRQLSDDVNPNSHPGGVESSGQCDDEVWLSLESGGHTSAANITLARRHLESSWSIKSSSSSPSEHPTAAGPSSSSSSSSSSGSSGSSSERRQRKSKNGFTLGSKGSGSSSSGSSSGVGAAAASSQPPGLSSVGGKTLPQPPPSAAAVAASSAVVRQVLQLLSCVSVMKLPVEEEWVCEVLGALRGHFGAVGRPELQRLLLLRELLGASPDPDWVDELLTECRVSPAELTDPLDQLHLLQLLAASQTRPNNMWWQNFLMACQDSLPVRYSAAQHVMLLALLADLGGRPPQSWLAAHEASLLGVNEGGGQAGPAAAAAAGGGGGGGGGQALGLEGWLLLLQCYGKLMYKPSSAFESLFECHAHGLLQCLSAGELSSLVASVARLTLPLSAQLEEGITRQLDKVLPGARLDELQGLVEGLLLLEVQLPSPTLRKLCAVVQPHLRAFRASATCSLLQLMSREGEYPPSPLWMDQVFGGLEPQLNTLEALPALQLLQSLKEFHTQPPQKFTLKLQARLVQLTKNLDAMGVATMVQGLVACGVSPSLELQQGLARHIHKGLARPSQGMGGTPVWILLGALLQAANRPVESCWSATSTQAGTLGGVGGTSGVICPEFLDELLHQVAALLSEGAASSSRLCRQVLPSLAAAFVPGSCWAPRPGFSYTPSAGFCAALCAAMLELQDCEVQLCSVDDVGAAVQLSGLLWLGLLVRFGDMAGFKPSAAWVQASNEAILSSWGGSHSEGAHSSRVTLSVQQNQQQGLVLPAAAAAAAAAAARAAAWGAAPAPQLAAWLSAVGRLQHEPSYLPGWPDHMLARLQVVLGEMNGHELSVALLGLAHQQQLAEMAAAGAALPPSSRSSMLAADSSSSGGSMLAALAAVKPQLLAAAEAVSWQHLTTLDAADLATLAHAFQQLGHTPPPDWVSAWSTAVAAQLPGCSAAAAVLQLVALAGFSARPSAELLQQLVSRCHAGLVQLQLQDLLGFSRALLLLGFRPDSVLLQDVLRAGQAAATQVLDVTGGAGSSGAAGAAAVQVHRAQQAHLLVELQQVAVFLAG